MRRERDVLMVPVAKNGVEMNNEVLLLRGEGAALEIGAEIVDPTEAAALTAALKAGVSGDVAPAALAVGDHVIHQLLVFLRRPQPLPQLRLRHIVIVIVAVVVRFFFHHYHMFRLPHDRIRRN